MNRALEIIEPGADFSDLALKEESRGIFSWPSDASNPLSDKICHKLLGSAGVPPGVSSYCAA